MMTIAQPGLLSAGRCGLLLLGFALLVACATEQRGEENTPTLFLVGDSTMANQPEEKYPEQGWGQALPKFLRSGIELRNHARNGRSTKSFMDQGHWRQVLDRLQPGDFVVIGFGHNDQKQEDSDRYAAPWSAYRYNLEQFVDQSLARGARPILVTSIYRRRFDDQGRPLATLGDYPTVARAVATERKVPLIDLNDFSRELLMDEGPKGSADLFMQIEPGAYPNLPEGKDDDTHLQARGAEWIARHFVVEVQRQGLSLSAYLVAPDK